MASTPWATGAARFEIQHDRGDSDLIVCVRCRLGSLPETEFALLDTGAFWSVIGGDLYEQVEAHVEVGLDEIQINTRLGTFGGHLSRLRTTLVADHGDDLEISATVLLVPDWPGPVVIGFRGLLERVRFALDPGPCEWFYFGPSGSSSGPDGPDARLLS